MAARVSRNAYEQALARGRWALDEPHAVSARYIAHARVLELVYSNGLTLRIDPKEVPVLKYLPRDLLMQACVTPGGDGLVFGESEHGEPKFGELRFEVPTEFRLPTVAG